MCHGGQDARCGHAERRHAAHHPVCIANAMAVRAWADGTFGLDIDSVSRVHLAATSSRILIAVGGSALAESH